MQDLKNKLLIAYSPFENENNRYTDNFKKILSHFGEIAEAPSLKKIFGNLSVRRFDVLILNWSDNSFVNGRTGAISFFGIAKEFLRVAVFKLIARKMIFVRHNVYPHSATGKSRETASRIIETYEKCFDLCWVHSGHLVEDKRFYVPHPLYEVADRLPPATDHLHLPEKYFIVFGRILSYKKIDRLLEILPSDIHVVVCGSCSDQAYREKLQSFSKSNITIIAEFIPDELARSLIERSSGMVICHADDDMIVSGSIIFAISLGVPVFAIETPFVHWFRDAVNDRMLVAAADFPDLVEKMQRYQFQITDADIALSQLHFCDQAVISQVALTFNRLNLI